MQFKNKWLPISMSVSGVAVALSNAYLFLEHPAVWQGIMFFVGIGWIWLGIDGVRRLNNSQPK